MKIRMIYLAAGYSLRFGSNKLCHVVDGKPMFQHGLEALLTVLRENPDTSLTVVTEYPEIRDFVSSRQENWDGRLSAVGSPERAKGISGSIKAGLSAGEADYYLFSVADQPWIDPETVLELIRKTTEGGYDGGDVSMNGVGGNPAIFSHRLRPELMALTGDTGGKRVLKNHRNVCTVQAKAIKELIDIDEKSSWGGRKMNFLEERIQKDGIVKEGNVLKVDSFLNHQMDISLLEEMGKEFKRRFADAKVDKILTIEASGIGIACIAAIYFDVPVVFAKKSHSINLDGEMYVAEVESFTHKCKNQVIVSRKFLSPGEHVLLIDDFLANGCALQGLISIVGQAGAVVEGIGIAIEKGFQSGGRTIRNLGYRLESLAIVDGMDAETGGITFREQ